MNKELLTKYKSKLNGFEGPCGEINIQAVVNKFGFDEITIIENSELYKVKDPTSVSDTVTVYNPQKKKVKDIIIPYGARVVGVVESGTGVVVDISDGYFVFNNKQPRKATYSSELKEMEYLDSKLIKGGFDNSAYKIVLRDPISGHYVVMNGPCT